MFSQKLKYKSTLVIYNKNKKRLDLNWFKNDNKLFEKAISVNALKKAWSMLKSKLNMSIFNSNIALLNKIDNNWFIKTSAKLLKGIFKYPNKKQIYINKLNSNKKFISIYNPKIKIIEKALLNAIELQFDNSIIRQNSWIQKYNTLLNNNINYVVFHRNIYDFRSQKFAHYVLNNIKFWKINTTFLLDYEISKTFSNANQKYLKNLFNKQILDYRFWLEISKILKSGMFFELKYFFEKKNKKNQNSILCPFLFNLYMHELDKKIARLQKKAEKFRKNVICDNSETKKTYQKISYKILANKLINSFFSKPSLKKISINRCNSFYKNSYQGIHKCQKNTNLKIRHIQYVRYANNFLLGIVGNRDYATQIYKNINSFIQNNLHLQTKKNNFVNWNNKSIIFLEHCISIKNFKTKTSIKKDKLVSRFFEFDKYLAITKNIQLYSNILTQINVLLNKVKFSFNNSAIKRWIFNLQNKFDYLSKLNIKFYHHKIKSSTIQKLYNDLSQSNSEIINKLQNYYTQQANNLINKYIKSKKKKNQNDIVKKSVIDLAFKCKIYNPTLIHLNIKPIKIDNVKILQKKIIFKAPINNILANLCLKGYVHTKKKKAIANLSLILNTDFAIILRYNLIIFNLLNWFSGSNNLTKVKNIAQLLRKSCVLTLATKHKKNVNWVYTVYGNEIKVNKNKRHIQLFDRSKILNYPNKFNFNIDKFVINQLDLNCIYIYNTA
jgi:hypothetical protein